MGARAQRFYNNSAPQIVQALDYAFRHCGLRHVQEGSRRYTAQVGMHWPFTSYGEKIDICIAGPGEVHIESKYAMPTQVFELGDNLRNCERIIDAVEVSLRSQQPACPQCGKEQDSFSVGVFCTGCGFRFHDSSLNYPYPRVSGRTYLLSFALSLVIPFVLVGLLFYFVYSQTMPRY